MLLLLSSSLVFKNSILDGDNKAVICFKNDKENIVSYAKISNMDWYITITVDYDTVFHNLKDSLNTVGRRSIYTSIGILLLSMTLVLIISMDILKERKEKHELQELNKSLIDTKKVALDALVVAQNANKHKSIFLSNMSHDIRTPMNAIVGFCALIKHYYDDKDKVLEYSNKIESSSEHLLSLINNVLDMSKIESGKISLNYSNASIYEIVDEIRNFIAPQIKDKDQRLKISFHNIKHEILIIDKLRLNQILLNLLSNAIKYTPKNGVIILDIEEKDFNLDEANYIFKVKDNGIGMSQDFLNKIFDSFTREEDDKVNLIEGSGLGMAITKNIIDLMGGTINVWSQKDKGTIFTVSLSFTIARCNNKLAIPSSSNMSKNLLDSQEKDSIIKGKKVLVAEDNELNIDIIKEVLSILGASFDICINGKEAVDKFLASTACEYDVIFMDVQMPIMNGYKATKAIRNSSHLQAKKIPIIAMTANAFVEDVKEAMDCGMNAHISKPIKINSLLEILNKILNNKV